MQNDQKIWKLIWRNNTISPLCKGNNLIRNYAKQLYEFLLAREDKMGLISDFVLFFRVFLVVEKVRINKLERTICIRKINK